VNDQSIDIGQAQQLADGWSNRRDMLSPEEIERLTAPTTLPIQPPGNGSPPPLVPPDNPVSPVETFPVAPPAGPNIETLPAAPPLTAEDLICTCWTTGTATSPMPWAG
jgi:hypothetical protein